MTVDSHATSLRQQQLLAAFAQCAELVGGVSLRPGTTQLIDGDGCSLLMRAIENDVLQLGLRANGELAEALADTSVVLTPVEERSQPVRYGRLNRRGQLRFRGLEASEYRMTIGL